MILISILSLNYRWLRRITSVGVRCIQRLFNRPQDFETVINWGHSALKTSSTLAPFLFRFSIPTGIERSLYHLRFPSPLILAAFEGDQTIVQLWTGFGLGGATLKTILPEPRTGNPRPRISEVTVHGKPCLLNAMGLPGKGIDDFIHTLQKTPFSQTRPLGFSIGGHQISDYVLVFRKLYHVLSSNPFWQKAPVFFELNISCPNTADGQAITQHPELLTPLLTELRSLAPTAIIGVKFSPDQSNEALLTSAKLVSAFQFTYLTLGNTQLRTCSSLGLNSTALSLGKGGLSGSALYPRTLEMVKLLQPVGLPIIATGGISTAAQVQEMMAAGATLVGMATAVVQDPYTIVKINHFLKEQLR